MGHLTSFQKMDPFQKKICLLVAEFSNYFACDSFSKISYQQCVAFFSQTEEGEVRDAVLVTDGDNEIGQVRYGSI